MTHIKYWAINNHSMLLVKSKQFTVEFGKLPTINEEILFLCVCGGTHCETGRRSRCRRPAELWIAARRAPSRRSSTGRRRPPDSFSSWRRGRRWRRTLARSRMSVGDLDEPSTARGPRSAARSHTCRHAPPINQRNANKNKWLNRISPLRSVWKPDFRWTTLGLCRAESDLASISAALTGLPQIGLAFDGFDASFYWVLLAIFLPRFVARFSARSSTSWPCPAYWPKVNEKLITSRPAHFPSP